MYSQVPLLGINVKTACHISCTHRSGSVCVKETVSLREPHYRWDDAVWETQCAGDDVFSGLTAALIFAPVSDAQEKVVSIIHCRRRLRDSSLQTQR